MDRFSSLDASLTTGAMGVDWVERVSRLQSLNNQHARSRPVCRAGRLAPALAVAAAMLLHHAPAAASAFHTEPLEDPALVAWWPLDGDAEDLGAHAMHGSVQSTLPTEDRFGRPARALYFDGTATVTVPHFPAQDQLAGLTLSLWMKADSFPGSGSRMLLGKSNYVTATNYLLRLRPGGNLQWEYQDYTETNGGPLQAGRWHHVAVTAEAPALDKRIYIDGEEVAATNPPGGAFGLVSDPLTFGWAGYGAEYFIGALDEVRIHARALDVEEIRALMLQHDRIFADGFEGGARDSR